ncbi:hypothetical protein INT47_005044 [Mucor saturninus]|uniref:RNA-directed DNA polymerase n=1 Tax=Mucor saturninus TaxID=64648 RepID=A0A8H7QM93_9FUNG|nr:hypothetical protein INT47_005044 [Mucor saturninus]
MDEVVENSGHKKGKARADGNIYIPPLDPYYPPESSTRFETIHRGDFNKLPPIQIDQQMGEAKPKRKRVVKEKAKVEVEIEDTWDKLKNTPVTISVAEYMALSKKAARDVKDGIMYIHRRVNRKAQRAKHISKDPVVVNALRANGLLDEKAYDNLKIHHASIHTNDSSMKNFVGDEECSESGSENEGSSSGSSDEEDSESSDDDSWDSVGEEESIIDYPFNAGKMRNAKPSRIFVSINDHLVEAILDSGAAVSVCSKKLADRLGLRINTNDKIPLTGFASNKSVFCSIAPNVEVKVGGKKRVEHFGIDQSQEKKDVCLLGRTWIKAHDIRLIKNGKMIMVPTNNGKKYIEVSCIDDDDEENENDPPVIYKVMVKQDDGNDGVDLATYQEDIVSQGSFIDENEAREISGGDGAGSIPTYLQSMIEKYKLCFIENNGMGKVTNVQHNITTTDNVPVKSKPYRLSYDEEDSLKEELSTLLELGLITPSTGMYTSPIFFVPKKNTKKMRLVVNYAQLNKKTVKDGYPLPHIDEVLDSLAGAKVFSTLDAAQGFWQVTMLESGREKTGFVCKFGTYVFNVMPFGLTNAGATFQRMMTTLLHDFIGKFVYIFIDDILVYSEDEASHAEHLKLIFEACNKGNLRLRREKCQFGKTKVVYLGHEVGAAGLEPAQENIEKILKLKEPKNKDEIRSLLGTTGYFRRFIEDYAAKAHPLTKLLKKEVAFEWTKVQQDAFNYLISTLMSPPILSFPIREYVKILTVDASYKGLGAILSQSPTGSEDNETVISYASKSVNHGQLNYTVSHLEALAIIWAVNRFRYYLSYKEEFIIRTDHAALEFILNNEKPSPKLERWKACLMGHKYRVVYKRGKDNPADALSRLI